MLLAGPLPRSTVNQVVVQFPTGDPNTDYKTRVCCRTIDAYEAFASAERTITVFPARPAQTVFASRSVLATTLNAARQSRVTLSLW